MVNRPRQINAYCVLNTFTGRLCNCGLLFQVTHTFKNYGKGVRYVQFVHGGKDTQFWAGWYGIRVTNSCVEICPAGER